MTDETAVQGVTIETSDRTLTITDIKKPVWHGDYHGGKLAIYHVLVNGTHSSDAITVVAVFTDAAGEDFVFSSDYVPNLTFEEIAAHICTSVVIQYQKTKAITATATATASTYVPGNDTRQ